MKTGPGWSPRADAPPSITRVEPPDGATQVLCDAPVIVRLSRPLDPASVSTETFSIQDSEGPVPGSVQISPDLRGVVWGGERHLRPGALHFVVARGLRDDRGRPIPPLWSCFIPCDLARDDLRQ